MKYGVAPALPTKNRAIRAGVLLLIAAVSMASISRLMEPNAHADDPPFIPPAPDANVVTGLYINWAGLSEVAVRTNGARIGPDVNFDPVAVGSGYTNPNTGVSAEGVRIQEDTSLTPYTTRIFDRGSGPNQYIAYVGVGGQNFHVNRAPEAGVPSSASNCASMFLNPFTNPAENRDYNLCLSVGAAPSSTRSWWNGTGVNPATGASQQRKRWADGTVWQYCDPGLPDNYPWCPVGQSGWVMGNVVWATYVGDATVAPTTTSSPTTTPPPATTVPPVMQTYDYLQNLPGWTPSPATPASYAAGCTALSPSTDDVVTNGSAGGYTIGQYSTTGGGPAMTVNALALAGAGPASRYDPSAVFGTAPSWSSVTASANQQVAPAAGNYAGAVPTVSGGNVSFNPPGQSIGLLQSQLTVTSNVYTMPTQETMRQEYLYYPSTGAVVYVGAPYSLGPPGYTTYQNFGPITQPINITYAVCRRAPTPPAVDVHITGKPTPIAIPAGSLDPVWYNSQVAVSGLTGGNTRVGTLVWDPTTRSGTWIPSRSWGPNSTPGSGRDLQLSYVVSDPYGKIGYGVINIFVDAGVPSPT